MRLNLVMMVTLYPKSFVGSGAKDLAHDVLRDGIPTSASGPATL